VGFLCSKKENGTNRSVNVSKGEKAIKNISQTTMGRKLKK
jgi:hypothetical protein